MKNEYQHNWEKLKYYLNVSLPNDTNEEEKNPELINNKKRKKDVEQEVEEEIFKRKIDDYLSLSFSLLQKSSKYSIDNYLQKTQLSRNFLLSSIDSQILDLSIEEIIKLLEEVKKTPKENRRNCLSLSENPIQTQKFIFDLKRIFKGIKADHSKVLHINTNDNVSLNNTPCFKKNQVSKPNSTKNLNLKNHNYLASLYRSPSPIIIHKSKKMITSSNDKNNSNNSKETYKTPDKKNIWVY